MELSCVNWWKGTCHVLPRYCHWPSRSPSRCLAPSMPVPPKPCCTTTTLSNSTVRPRSRHPLCLVRNSEAPTTQPRQRMPAVMSWLSWKPCHPHRMKGWSCWNASSRPRRFCSSQSEWPNSSICFCQLSQWTRTTTRNRVLSLPHHNLPNYQRSHKTRRRSSFLFLAYLNWTKLTVPLPCNQLCSIPSWKSEH